MILFSKTSEEEYRGEKWGRAIQPVTNVSLQMNPPPLPGSDDITTIPYGKRDNFCLAILIFIHGNVGNLLLYQHLEQLIKEEDEWG